MEEKIALQRSLQRAMIIGALEELKSEKPCRITQPVESRLKRMISVAVYDGRNAELCRDAECLIVAEGVRKIEAEAFAGCEKLRGVILPNSVTELAERAFENCVSLGVAVLPARLRRLGDRCFYGCTNLEHINDTDWIEGSIGAEAFAGCTSLPRIRVGAVTLGEGVFENCSSLAVCVCEGGIRRVPARAFRNCVSLQQIRLSACLEEVGDEAFAGCISLREYSDTVHVDGVIAGCGRIGGRIDEVKLLPGRVRHIGKYAFRNCKALTVFPVPSSLCKIDDGAFAGCSALEVFCVSGYYSQEPFILGVEVFAGCEKLILDLGDNALSGLMGYALENGLPFRLDAVGRVLEPGDPRLAAVCPGESVIENAYGRFEIDSGVLKCYVGPGGFIELPDSVLVREWDAFMKGRGREGSCWEHIVIDGDVVAAGVLDGDTLRFPKGAKRLKCRPEGWSNTRRVVFPDGFESICDSAFAGWSELREVYFPSTLKEIGSSAFEDCVRLKRVSIPGGVKSLGALCFCGCERLRWAFIGEGVKELGPSAFANCPALRHVRLPDSLEFIGNYAFENCSDLTDIAGGGCIKGVGLRCFSGTPVNKEAFIRQRR